MKQYKKNNIGKLTVDNGFCIGCGFCSPLCPEHAITMVFNEYRQYVPVVEQSLCTQCSQCLSVCPNTPKTLSEYLERSLSSGLSFGLNNSFASFVGYDPDMIGRMNSASGGVVTALLKEILSKRIVDGVITARADYACYGEKFCSIRIIRSSGELESSRSSFYYPVTYAHVLETVRDSKETYALVGIPCIMRAVRQLPREIQKRITFTISLFCSFNHTGQFLESLARREGLRENDRFKINFRDKYDIPSGSKFNNCFTTAQKEIRRGADGLFIPMHKYYFFSQNACLYCPDAYGADADISAKDPWGTRHFDDRHGSSFVIVRNEEIRELFVKLQENGKIYLVCVSTNEIGSSQQHVVRFKHIGSRERFLFKKALRKQVNNSGVPYRLRDVLKYLSFLDYGIKLMTLKISRWQFRAFPRRSLNWLLTFNKIFHVLLKGLRKLSPRFS